MPAPTVNNVAFYDTPPATALLANSPLGAHSADCVAYKVGLSTGDVVWVLQHRSIFDEKDPDQVKAEVEQVALLKAEGKLGIVDKPDVSAEP